MSRGRPILPATAFRWDLAAVLFLVLFGTYSYFWQRRAWNESSRLILTYAILDRGTISVDGLQAQSGDVALVDGHYYTYKPPGQSFLGVPFYALLKFTGISHPIDAPRIPFWWPDYVLTLATSGVLTAALGVLVYWTALRLGCSSAPALAVALGYGLASPAFPYATLYAGHQTAAFMAFAAFAVLARCEWLRNWPRGWMFAAGLLAGYAVMTEYTLVFASLGLLIYAYWSGCPLRRLWPFVLAAGLCAVGLGIYHTSAFGGPFQTGYVHATDQKFQQIYSPDNPIGLTRPTFKRACKILFSSHGLIWYAPLVLLAPMGFVRLIRQRQWKLLFVTATAFGSLLVINAAHPTWSAGWTTGPRYLLAGLPFLMLPVAAAVAGKQRWPVYVLGALALIGLVICLGCTAIPEGGRLPDIDVPNGDAPLTKVVFPHLLAGRFGRNIGNLLLYGQWEFPGEGNWAALAPLLVFWQVLLLISIWRSATARAKSTALPLSRGPVGDSLKS